MTSASKFYDDLAEQYDAMTRAKPRVERERPVVQGLIQQFNIKRCLDAACGTGIHSLLFAEEGVSVTAADLSPKMLARAKQQATDSDLSIEFVQSSFADLPEQVSSDHDAVICLGNSLPHLLTSEYLRAACKGFAAALRPGGVMIIQILNYAKILRDQVRIVGAHRAENVEFVRFYDFLDDHIRFNIMRLYWNGNQCTPRLSSTELYPYVLDELKPALEEAGFGTIQSYGDLSLTPFDSDSSSNLVVVTPLA